VLYIFGIGVENKTAFAFSLYMPDFVRGLGGGRFNGVGHNMCISSIIERLGLG